MNEGLGRLAWDLRLGAQGLGIWEFPKIGDANIVPQIVGSLL